MQHKSIVSPAGKAFMTMVTWSAGNADLNPLYEQAHNPGGRMAGWLGGSSVHPRCAAQLSELF